MKALKQVFGGNLQQYTMVLALVVLAISFHIMTDGGMITSSNLQNLIIGNAYVFILAIGMVMVIVVGHIDLSVGSVAAFVAMFVATMCLDYSLPWWVGVLIGLAAGAVVGAWHGFWLAKVGIPGFITTLAGMLIFRGLVIWISGSVSKAAPREFRTFGSGHFPEWGPNTGMNNTTLLMGLIAVVALVYGQLRRRARMLAAGQESPMWALMARLILLGAVIGYATYLFGTGRPGTSFPIPGLILVVLILFYHVLTTRTTFGRHIYAVGGNRSAAALSGVNVSKVYFFVMLNMSVLAAIAGMVFMGRSTSAGPAMGTMWELDAIAAVFIGGAAVSGGIGTIGGTVVGALLMAVLNSGLTLMGVGQDRTQVIKGLVLLAAVAVDVYNKRQGRASILDQLSKMFNISKPEPDEHVKKEDELSAPPK